MNAVVLYGSPMSLYTGRARSYLIKTGVPYREVPHASPHFYKTVLPKAGGRRGIPTLEFPDGNVIRDGVAIIDHFENLNGHQHAPKTPKQNIVSLLLDVIAAEGLLRPCMCTSSDLVEPFDPISKRHFSAGDFSSLTC